MPNLPFRAGKYTAFDRLASGGMADLYLACQQHEGTARLAVLKLIQDDHAANEDFARMFNTEVQLSTWLNHANIVQVYDIGKVEEAPYLAMEYLDGCSLRELMTQTREESEEIPVEIVLLVAEQALQALSYAHELCHPIHKTPLGVVHRDVSPSNILVTYDGVVKLIDFGIAKITARTSATRTGLIKGKARYFSPEQIEAKPLDQRTDVFALGIILWELLCGRTLFDGKGGPEISAQIVESDRYVQRPSKVRPGVPKELDYLVLKALAGKRDKRYATSRDFLREVRALIQSRFPQLEPSVLRRYVESQFQEKKYTDAQRIARALGFRKGPPAAGDASGPTEVDEDITEPGFAAPERTLTAATEAVESRGLAARWRPFVQFSPIVHDGAPTVGSQQTRVSEVLETLSWTGQFSSLRKALPSVTREEVLACLAYAADQLMKKPGGGE